MGWPSTEKEFSAWSPSPWNRPLESATTPGDTSVTSELTDDDWLSSGSLSVRLVSTSVMKTGIVLNQIGAVSLHSDAGACRADLQGNLHGRWNGGPHLYVLRVRVKTRGRRHQVIPVERHVCES